MTWDVAFIAGDAFPAFVFCCAFFFWPRFDTVPVVVLLFSDDVLEPPLFALRLLRLRDMATSGKAPTTGVEVLDVRPGRPEAGAGAGVSISMLSGSGCPTSSTFIFDVSNVGCASAGSFGVDVTFVEALSRVMPAACSISAITLLVGICCTEWEEDGRRPGGTS